MIYYYIAADNEKGFEEITETEWNAIIGTEEIRPYVYKVYRGLLSIDEVPEELREQVQTIVNNKIARWGEYKNQEINSNELQSMIEEVL